MTDIKMDAADFLREYARMCSTHDGFRCNCCELQEIRRKVSGTCKDAILAYPAEAVRIVSGWSIKHPQRTLRDIVLEKFPDASFDVLCPEGFWPIYHGESYRCDDNCEACWNRFATEVEGK